MLPLIDIAADRGQRGSDTLQFGRWLMADQEVPPDKRCSEK